VEKLHYISLGSKVYMYVAPKAMVLELFMAEKGVDFDHVGLK